MRSLIKTSLELDLAARAEERKKKLEREREKKIRGSAKKVADPVPIISILFEGKACFALGPSQNLAKETH